MPIETVAFAATLAEMEAAIDAAATATAAADSATATVAGIDDAVAAAVAAIPSEFGDRVTALEVGVGEVPAEEALRDLVRNYSGWDVDFGRSRWSYGYSAGEPFRAVACGFDVQIGSSVATLTLRLYTRPLSSAYTGQPSTADGDTLIATQAYPRSGFTAGAGWQTIRLDHDPLEILGDEILLVRLDASDSGGGVQPIGMGGHSGITYAAQYQRGWYGVEGGGIPSGYSLAGSVFGYRGLLLHQIESLGARLEAEEALGVSRDDRLTDLERVVGSAASAATPVTLANYPRNYSLWDTDFGRTAWAIYHLARSPQTVNSLSVDLMFVSTAVTVTSRVFIRRASSTYVLHPAESGGDALLETVVQPTPSGTGWQTVTTDFTPVSLAAGDVLLMEVSAQNASSVDTSIGCGGREDSTNTEPSPLGGYYLPAGGPWGGVGTPYRLAYAATGWAGIQTLLGWATAETEKPVAWALRGGAVVAGRVIHMAGLEVYREGSWQALSGSVTVAAEGSGNTRYDLVELNRDTLTVSLVAGTSRAQEPEEYAPAHSAGKLPLYYAVLRSGLVTLLPLWKWTGGVLRVAAETEAERLKAYAKSQVGGTLARLSAGLSVNVATYGTSITAFMDISSGVTTPYTPNGTMRDRIAYLESYGSDFLATIPLYDHGDGAGTVHTHLSYGWVLRDALARRYAGTITYQNFGIPGATSGTGSNNALRPERLAALLAADPDVVVIELGMNEAGSTDTYANVVTLIGNITAAGASSVVLGMPRPSPDNTSITLTQWRYTNHALESAARDAGAAWAPTDYLMEDGNLASIGMHSSRLCAANGWNHPGIREHLGMGRLLAYLFDA